MSVTRPIPGGAGFVIETDQAARPVPGAGFVIETQAAAGESGDVFIEGLQEIQDGIKVITAAGMNGVLVT